jgi:hypothetical protein
LGPILGSFLLFELSGKVKAVRSSSKQGQPRSISFCFLHELVPI